MGTNTRLTLGFVITIIVIIGGIGAGYLRDSTTFRDHTCATAVHHSTDELVRDYIPRVEYTKDQLVVHEDLKRIERGVNKLLDMELDNGRK